jgi:hypothetical protein
MASSSLLNHDWPLIREGKIDPTCGDGIGKCSALVLDASPLLLAMA